MAIFESTQLVSANVAEIFAFFATPANLAQLALPEARLELVDAPAMLSSGAVLTWKVRRWGLVQQIMVRVREIQPGRSIVMVQEKGPVKKWIHEQCFEEVDHGTKINDRIEYEPPGGLLGLTVTEKFLRADLERSFAYRDEQLKEFFPATSSK